MDLQSELEHSRNEHDDILRFLREFEAALTLAAGKGAENRCQALARLSELRGKLDAIRDHCRQEETSADSPLRTYLDERAIEHLHNQHDRLDRLGDAFCAELKLLTTPPPTGELVGIGMQLLEQLRRHVAYEEGLLKQIEDGTASESAVYLKPAKVAE
jgi:hypothetical protein